MLLNFSFKRFFFSQWHFKSRRLILSVAKKCIIRSKNNFLVLHLKSLLKIVTRKRVESRKKHTKINTVTIFIWSVLQPLNFRCRYVFWPLSRSYNIIQTWFSITKATWASHCAVIGNYLLILVPVIISPSFPIADAKLVVK